MNNYLFQFRDVIDNILTSFSPVEEEKGFDLIEDYSEFVFEHLNHRSDKLDLEFIITELDPYFRIGCGLDFNRTFPITQEISNILSELSFSDCLKYIYELHLYEPYTETKKLIKQIRELIGGYL